MATKATLADRRQFGARLKQFRQAKGWNQRQLAERANMHQVSISQIEHALREPTWTTVLALANALGVSCDAFRDDAPQLSD